MTVARIWNIIICVSISGSTFNDNSNDRGIVQHHSDVSKTNYSSASDSFTLTVVPELAFVNSPWQDYSFRVIM